MKKMLIYVSIFIFMMKYNSVAQNLVITNYNSTYDVIVTMYLNGGTYGTGSCIDYVSWNIDVPPGTTTYAWGDPCIFETGCASGPATGWRTTCGSCLTSFCPWSTYSSSGAYWSGTNFYYITTPYTYGSLGTPNALCSGGSTSWSSGGYSATWTTSPGNLYIDFY